MPKYIRHTFPTFFSQKANMTSKETEGVANLQVIDVIAKTVDIINAKYRQSIAYTILNTSHAL
jgi:hypothetical protein